MADPDKSTAVRHRLLVLASTYPRWSGDHEPGFVHELNRRLVDSSTCMWFVRMRRERPVRR